METLQVDSRRRHPGHQPGNEIQRLEDDVRRAVTMLGLELITDISFRDDRGALIRNLLAFIRSSRHTGV